MRKTAFICNLIFFAIFSLFGQSTNDKYYGKHIIIAVDQTSDVQSHKDIGEVKQWLKQLLCNQTISAENMDSQAILPVDFTFNENTDRISLFAFGIEGKSEPYPYDKQRNAFMRIKKKQNSENIDNSEIVEAILSERMFFSGNEGDIDTYVSTVIDSLLSGKDPKSSVIQDIGGVTMSYYVYPPILNLVDVTIPAEDYYFIMITNFRSGSSDGINSDDEKRLQEMLTKLEVRNSFKDMCAKLDAQYTKTKIFSLIPKPTGVNDAKRPILTMYKLMPLNSIGKGAQADIETPISLKEEEHESGKFNIDEVTIKLPIEEIRTILVSISCDGKEIHREVIAKDIDACKSLYKDKKYTIHSITLDDKDKVLKVGSKLSFKYVFYPNNAEGNKLPMVYVDEQTLILKDKDFASVLAGVSSHRVYLIVVLASIFVVLIWLSLRLWNKRGLDIKENISFDCEIQPLSRHYMRVKNNEVISMDCWCVESEDPRPKLIHVIGHFGVSKKNWAKKYDYQLKYQVTDNNRDTLFSLRPSGIDTHGCYHKEDEWYSLKVEPNGYFSFEVESYLDRENFHPEEFENRMNDLRENEQNHIQELILSFEVCIVDSDNRIVKKLENIACKKYSFIVRPPRLKQNENGTDTWIAFDPGTTGACATISYKGLPFELNNIIVVKNRVISDSKETEDPIFPSKIRIFGNCPVNENVLDADRCEEGEEGNFVFGNNAENRDGTNIFQSIKKLLGYTTRIKVYTENGHSCETTGKDLAYLLAKGLYKRVEDYVMGDDTDDEIKKNFKNGTSFCPQRAIVAVPNNYTVQKIQEMVGSIERLSVFEEVHYIYESEAVFMSYCRKEYRNLNKMADDVFIVFDMGGATINVTAFSIKITLGNRNNIEKLVVSTMSKVGFYVGGDDIDYAIIKSLYSIPRVKECFESGEEIKQHMLHYKQELLKTALEIKKEIKDNGFNLSPEEFVNKNYFKDLHLPKAIIRPDGSDPNDRDVWNKEFFNSFNENLKNNLEKYVYNPVADAIEELIDPIQSGKNVRAIFSGRSSVFGRVKSIAVENLRKKFKKVAVWDGFNNKNNELDIEQVKTAVAIGANWYARFSHIVHLEHNIVPTTIGFIDMVENTYKFIPLIQRNNPFEENNKVSNDETFIPPIQAQDIQFVQMQGSNYEKIVKDFYDEGQNNNRHKMVLLDYVPENSINGPIRKITATLDNLNNFTYNITADEEINSKGHPRVVETEIKDEQNESYIYSISQPMDNEFGFERGSTNAEKEKNTTMRNNDTPKEGRKDRRGL